MIEKKDLWSADFSPHARGKSGLHFRIAFVILVIASLGCNAVTRGFEPTPLPETATPTLLAPAYIPPGCEGVPLATVPPATAAAMATSEVLVNPALSTEQQLRIFDGVVDAIDETYVYPDFNGIDWPATVAGRRADVEAGLETEAFYLEIQRMVEELGDEHSAFEPPVVAAAMQAELAGTNEFVGIGVSVMPEVEKEVAILMLVYPDSPAEQSGLRAHDSVIAVDGLPVVVAGELLMDRMRGPACSAVRLTVRSPGESPRDVLILRQRIAGGLPVESRLVTTSDGSRIGYIMLPSFFDQTIPGKVEAALTELGPLDGLILDNRLNHGGSRTVLEAVLAFFTSGTLGTFESRNGSRPLTIDAGPVHNSQTVPLVVLVSEETASYAEVFAGVLKDSGRASLVGEATFGNVETLHAYHFEDGSVLWIAEETFDPAVSHADWEAIGIIPDVRAHAAWDTFTFESDPAVAAAVTLLGHQ